MYSLALEMEASKEVQRGVVRILVAECAATRYKVKTTLMLSDVIMLLHDNARPHTANLITDKLQRFGWETLKHPPYSPDLFPCDVHIFWRPEERQSWTSVSIGRGSARVDQVVIHQRPASFYKTRQEKLCSKVRLGRVLPDGQRPSQCYLSMVAVSRD